MYGSNNFTNHEPDSWWHPWSDIYTRPASDSSLLGKVRRFVITVGLASITAGLLCTTLIVWTMATVFGDTSGPELTPVVSAE